MTDAPSALDVVLPGVQAREAFLDDVRTNGFSRVRGVVGVDELREARTRIDAVHDQQQLEFGHERLDAIGELDLARAPLVSDEFFLRSVAAHPTALALAALLIGDYVVLHLQNAVINRPGTMHHQATWHRDLPYQQFVASPPLAVSILYCIDDFTVRNGCTWCVPGSHRSGPIAPVEHLAQHARAMEADAGDLLVFDSMLVHRAGTNSGPVIRRGINNVYSVAVVHQQIDLPRALEGRYADDESLARLLGYRSQPAASVGEYRQRRADRTRGT